MGGGQTSFIGRQAALLWRSSVGESQGSFYKMNSDPTYFQLVLLRSYKEVSKNGPDLSVVEFYIVLNNCH